MGAWIYTDRSSSSSKTNRNNRLISKIRKTATSLRYKAIGLIRAQKSPVASPTGGFSPLDFNKRMSSSSSLACSRSRRSTDGKRMSIASIASSQGRSPQPSICLTAATVKGKNPRYSLHFAKDVESVNEEKLEAPVVRKQVSQTTVAPEALLSPSAQITHADGSAATSQEIQKFVEILRLNGHEFKVVANKPRCNQNSQDTLGGAADENAGLLQERKLWAPARPSTPRFAPIPSSLPSLETSQSLSAMLSTSSSAYYTSADFDTKFTFSTNPQTASQTSAGAASEPTTPATPTLQTLPPTVYTPYVAPFAPYGPTDPSGPTQAPVKDPRTPFEIAQAKRQSAFIRAIEDAILSPMLPPVTANASPNPAPKQAAYERRPYFAPACTDDVFAPSSRSSKPHAVAETPMTTAAAAAATALSQWPARSSSLPKHPFQTRQPAPPTTSPAASAVPVKRKPLPSPAYLAPLPAPSAHQEATPHQSTTEKSGSRLRRSRLEAALPPIPRQLKAEDEVSRADIRRVKMRRFRRGVRRCFVG
ncbi:hypothetical protein MBLNU230_g8398t1 [Neophaeotheca triangularis]